MAAPQPKTQAERVSDRLDALARKDDVTVFEERSIRKEAEEIGRTDRLTADMIICDLESLLGNRAALMKVIASMEVNGFAHDAGFGKFFFHGRFLQASKAHALLNFVFPHPNRPLQQSVQTLFLIGAFRPFLGFLDRASEGKVMLNGITMISEAKKIVAILDGLHISDQQIAEIIDQAGDVMESHGLHRTREVLHFGIPPNTDDDTPNGSLHIEYRVATTPEVASEMNWELLDRIVDRDLDVAGLTVGFAGTK